MEAVLQAEYSDELISWRVAYGKVSTGCQERFCQFSLVYDAYKYYRNVVFWKHSSTSAKLPVGKRSTAWLTDFETPADIKTDPIWIIISHKQWKTMHARSGLGLIQAEIFPSVARVENTWVIFWVLDQRTDYVNRSSERLCNINWFYRSSKRRER